jgi:hypothetical protein
MHLVSGFAAEKPLNVAISSTAKPEYVRPVDAQGRPRPETYVFYEGNFMGGGTVDKRQDNLTYTDLTRLLAKSLAKQNYFPTKAATEADLIIMVHWGTTLVYDDSLEKQAAIAEVNGALNDYSAAVSAGSLPDPGPLNAALSRKEAYVGSVEEYMNRNAALLGYTRALDKARNRFMSSPEELTMSIELTEERYFVVLMAYDNHYLQKQRARKLLWVTRLSVRSPGNNFLDAIHTLTVAGGEVFGQQLDGLKRVKVPVRGGEVKLHDLKILGEETKPVPEPAGK